MQKTCKYLHKKCIFETDLHARNPLYIKGFGVLRAKIHFFYPKLFVEINYYKKFLTKFLHFCTRPNFERRNGWTLLQLNIVIIKI